MRINGKEAYYTNMGWKNFEQDARVKFNTMEAVQTNNGRKPTRDEVQQWLAEAYNFLDQGVRDANLQVALQEIITREKFVRSWTSRQRDEWIHWDNWSYRLYLHVVEQKNTNDIDRAIDEPYDAVGNLIVDFKERHQKSNEGMRSQILSIFADEG